MPAWRRCRDSNSFASTAIQELREETALEASEQDLIAFGSSSVPDIETVSYPSGDTVQYFALSFVLRKWSELDQELIDKYEVKKVEFFLPASLPGNLHKASAYQIEMYRRFLQTGEFQIG